MAVMEPMDSTERPERLAALEQVLMVAKAVLSAVVWVPAVDVGNAAWLAAVGFPLDAEAQAVPVALQAMAVMMVMQVPEGVVRRDVLVRMA